MVQPNRPQMTIRCMRFVCWKTEDTDTLRIHNTYSSSKATMVTQMQCNVTFIRTFFSLLTQHFITSMYTVCIDEHSKASDSSERDARF